MAERGDYDVIVLDVMMPRVDGIEALKRIRFAGDTTPIIMLTAKAEIDDRITGLDAGADDYLTKPFAIWLSPTITLPASMPITRGSSNASTGPTNRTIPARKASASVWQWPGN